MFYVLKRAIDYIALLLSFWSVYDCDGYRGGTWRYRGVRRFWAWQYVGNYVQTIIRCHLNILALETSSFEDHVCMSSGNVQMRPYAVIYLQIVTLPKIRAKIANFIELLIAC